VKWCLHFGAIAGAGPKALAPHLVLNGLIWTSGWPGSHLLRRVFSFSFRLDSFETGQKMHTDNAPGLSQAGLKSRSTV
jgi:hypothetical protein